MKSNVNGKKKINICFNCGEMCYSTEHHVKELGKEYTVEICQICHISLNHYQEEAIPKLRKFIENQK